MTQFLKSILVVLTMLALAQGAVAAAGGASADLEIPSPPAAARNGIVVSPQGGGGGGGGGGSLSSGCYIMPRTHFVSKYADAAFSELDGCIQRYVNFGVNITKYNLDDPTLYISFSTSEWDACNQQSVGWSYGYAQNSGEVVIDRDSATLTAVLVVNTCREESECTQSEVEISAQWTTYGRRGRISAPFRHEYPDGSKYKSDAKTSYRDADVTATINGVAIAIPTSSAHVGNTLGYYECTDQKRGHGLGGPRPH